MQQFYMEQWLGDNKKTSKYVFIYILLDDVDLILMYLLITSVSINFAFGIHFEKHGEENLAVKVILR